MRSKWELLSEEKPTHAKLKLGHVKFVMKVMHGNHSDKGHNHSRIID